MTADVVILDAFLFKRYMVAIRSLKCLKSIKAQYSIVQYPRLSTSSPITLARRVIFCTAFTEDAGVSLLFIVLTCQSCLGYLLQFRRPSSESNVHNLLIQGFLLRSEQLARR